MSVFSRLTASVTPTSSPAPAVDSTAVSVRHDVPDVLADTELPTNSKHETAYDVANDVLPLPDTADPAPETITFASAARLGTAQRPAIAFEDIVEKYHGKVFQLIYRYLGDYDEACDLTQDTFVRAYSAWGEFRGESQIYTWLYRIAINLCHNQQKKLQRRRRVERVSLDSTSDCENGQSSTQWSQWSSREVADERPLPLQVLESHEMRLRLQEALRELPENYRTVIVLRDIEGLSYEQIARITDSTLEAIKSRLFRARGAIRRLMEPYLMGEGALGAGDTGALAADNADAPPVSGKTTCGDTTPDKAGRSKERASKRERFRLL
jgi:RNA polymerase sigma-70 factor (ECF subfamily)